MNEHAEVAHRPSKGMRKHIRLQKAEARRNGKEWKVVKPTPKYVVPIKVFGTWHSRFYWKCPKGSYRGSAIPTCDCGCKAERPDMNTRPNW